jgi:hypothetical protein
MGFLKRAVFWTLALVYGVFTVILYACIAIKKGTYFTRRTEKEDLELQIGMYPPPSFIKRPQYHQCLRERSASTKIIIC